MCSSEAELTVTKKFQTKSSNPHPVKQNVSNSIQIHHKFENPPDLNPNPCSSLMHEMQFAFCGFLLTHTI